MVRSAEAPESERDFEEEECELRFEDVFEEDFEGAEWEEPIFGVVWVWVGVDAEC